MPRNRKSSADFPPEFLSAWQLAVKGELLIAMDSVGAARNLIQRLYSFRKRLMEEAPEIASQFYLVDLRVHNEMGNVIEARATAVPGKAIIKVYVPTWKAQIQKQAEERAEDKAVTQTPDVTEIAVPRQDSHLLAQQSSSDNLTEALSNAGYSTEGK